MHTGRTLVSVWGSGGEGGRGGGERLNSAPLFSKALLQSPLPSKNTHTHTQAGRQAHPLTEPRVLFRPVGVRVVRVCLTSAAGSFTFHSSAAPLTSSPLCWRNHERHLHQHAAQAADHLLHPGDHPHHPVLCTGGVWQRDRCKAVAQLVWSQLPEWILLPLPKWVSVARGYIILSLITGFYVKQASQYMVGDKQTSYRK